MNPLDLLKNEYVRGVLVLLLGITIGAIFYPTKKIEEKVSKKYEQQISQVKTEFQSYKTLSEEKIVSLNSQITDLNSQQKIVYTKITHPDGTVEVHSTTTKNTEETESKTSQTEQDKLTQVQNEFASKEADYKNTIATLQSSKTVSVNQKQFALEVGILSNKDYYGHITMDLWGPVFIGAHGEFGATNDNRLGAGVGIRF